MKIYIKYTLLLLAVYIGSISAQSIKIAVISDIHFLSSNLVKSGEALTKFEQSTGRDVFVLHEVLDKVFSEIVTEKVDILLIPGDLTNHGERESHKDLVLKLDNLVKQGVRVMVVPGNHDINIPNAKSYIGKSGAPVESISEEEFVSLYGGYGYNKTISRDEGTLSYLAEIDSKTWLLAFDTNLHKEYINSSISAGRISTETMEWALSVLRDAKSKEITVVGMMHHGLVEHLPYQSTFFSDYLVENWEYNSTLLADAGLQVMFTGHFHANDISLYTSPKGNKIYDIETASMASYPFSYRIAKIKDKTISIDTHLIYSIDSEDNLQNRYRKVFEEISKSSISARLKGMKIPLSEDANKAIVDLLTRMSLLHVLGDETIDEDTYQLVERFAEVIGDDSFDISRFVLDFPPSDNTLTIEFK